MIKITVALAFVLLFAGCNTKHTHKGFYNKPLAATNDSLKKRISIDSQMAAGDRPDSEQEGPTFKEVLAERLAAYNKIENINKLIVDGKDTLQLHETYYCLHDSSLIIPKHYLWGGDTTRDFVTNNFVSKIILVNDKDTVFNKIIMKTDFNSIIDDQLKKYAILFDSGYGGYNKTKGGFIFGYSVSIPLTDLGTAVHLVIDKNGNQKIIDDFTFINKYKETW
jgi:hypothetical protein